MYGLKLSRFTGWGVPHGWIQKTKFTASLNTPQFHSKRKCFFHYIHWLMFSLTLNSLLVHIKWNLDWRSVKTGNSKTYIAKVVKTFPLLFRKGFNDFFDVFKSINTNISKILFDYSFDLWINVLTRNDLLKRYW